MKIETKYDVGQWVWIVAPYFIKGKFIKTYISKEKIFCILIYRNDIVYRVAGRQIVEEDVFASKEEAIANQKRIEQKRIDIIEGKL